MPAAPALVVGLGHPDRGDDAIGHLVAHEVRLRRPTAVVRTLLEPLRLLDLMPGHTFVVVVDAATSSSHLGVVEVHDATRDVLPSASAGGSSHSLGVGEVIALARHAGDVPSQLTVVTVSGSRFSLGEPPQPEVLGAVAPAADAVLGLLDGTGNAALVRTGGWGSTPRRRP